MTDARDLEERIHELTQFVAQLQHEVNNPLAALLAEAQLLSLEPDLTTEHRAAVERVVSLVRRVAGSMRKFDQARAAASAP